MKLNRIILFFPFLILVSGCNKETYVESIGYAHVEVGEETEVGYFIFYSVNAASQCSPITIFLDGKEVGQLTRDYSSGSPDCMVEPIEGELIKVIAGLGSHEITAIYEGCDTEAGMSWHLPEASCRVLYLQR